MDGSKWGLQSAHTVPTVSCLEVSNVIRGNVREDGTPADEIICKVTERASTQRMS